MNIKSVLIGAFAALMLPVSAVAGVACERALDGMGTAVDVVNKIGDKCPIKGEDGYQEGCVLTPAEVDTWYRARKYHDQCLEVVLATCGCETIDCPPASSTAIEACKEVFVANYGTTEPGKEGVKGNRHEATYHSENIQQGVHYAAFSVPLDIFNPDRSKITITIKEGASPPIIPQFNAKGDVLYIREGSYDIDGKYKCRPTWYDSIEQANLSVADMWDQRGTSGAHSDYDITLKDVANCEAFANQAFTVEVVQTPESGVETNPSDPE